MSTSGSYNRNVHYDVLRQTKRKYLLKMIKHHGWDQDIDEEYKKKDGTMKLNMKSATYAQIIMRGLSREVDEMELIMDDHYNNTDIRSDAFILHDDGEVSGDPDAFQRWLGHYIASLRKILDFFGWCKVQMDNGCCLNPNCMKLHSGYRIVCDAIPTDADAGLQGVCHTRYNN